MQQEKLISKRKKRGMLALQILIYLFLVSVIILCNNPNSPIHIERASTFSGVITAFEFMVAIWMTLTDAKVGGRIAIGLLGFSVFSAAVSLVKTRDGAAAPGVCLMIAAIIAIMLIRHGIRKEQELSSIDMLTGIANRRSMVAMIHEYVERREPFYLLYMDLDHFKYLNDIQGHEKGDRVLRQVVELWQTVNCKQATLGRLGGDEFLCLVSRKEEVSIEDLAGRYVSALSGWKDDDRYSGFYLSVSIGIAAYPEDARTGKEILRKADIAMYSAKKDGRNSYCKYDAWFDRAFLREQNVEIILREAFKNHKFYLVYQPQFETNTKKIHGFEALIRLNNGNGEQIGPGEFIPVAEKSTLIIEIGEFVLREATKDFAPYMREHRDLTLSINISAKQILSDNFVELVRGILEENNFPAECLEIEITEYCLMDATEEAIAVINELKQTGIHLAMDDFGTGYSSLSYLTKLPIDMIKIDKSLIDTISEGEIVSAIISMGHALGCKLIAEGVEEQKQVELLAQKGCDYVQGFIWGKPMSFDKALETVSFNK